MTNGLAYKDAEVDTRATLALAAIAAPATNARPRAAST
jgi:hypothetical protein